MEVVRDGWMLDAGLGLKVKTADFTDRMGEGPKKRNQEHHQSCCLKIKRMLLPSTKEGNINERAALGEEKRGSVFPLGTW